MDEAEEEVGAEREREGVSGSHTVLGCCSSNRQSGCMGRLDGDDAGGASSEDQDGCGLKLRSPGRRHVIR